MPIFSDPGDVHLDADRNGDGNGRIIFSTRGIERAAINSDGTGSGWSTILGGSQTALGNASGGDDTAAIQALLNASGSFGGKPGQNYRISSPLILYDNTWLDMTGCTITLISGSNCRMVQSSNTTGGRNITDGVTTAASTTFTSATAAFTSADIGTSISIQGAGPFGQTLFTTISSVTNGTTVVLATAATFAVSGAVCGIGPRNTNISIVGGIWDRGSNGGALGTDRHSIVFRKVDRCSIKNASFKSAGGKFSVLFQSCTDYTADQIYLLSTFSDGVHVEGPCSRGQITNIRGSAGDDMVAVTPKDWTGYTWGDEGDVVELEIDGVISTLTTKCLVRVNGGTGKNCKGITVRTVHGTSLATAVWIGDDTGDAATAGGLLDNIVLDDIKVESANNAPQIKLNPSNGKRFTITAPHYQVDSFTGQNCIAMDASTSIAALEVADAEIVDGLNGSALVLVEGTCTILSVSNVKGTPVAGASIVKLDDANNASVTKMLIDGVGCAWQSVGGSIVRAIKATGHTITELHLTNIAATSASWLADIGTTTDVFVNGVRTDQGSFNIRATGIVNAFGHGNQIALAPGITAGGKLSLRIPDAAPTATAGGLPTAAAGVGLGTGPTVAIVGTDRVGTLTLTPGTTPAAGALVTVTFMGTWPQTPKVKLTPASTGAASANCYVSAQSTTAFTVSAVNAPSGSQVINYEVTA